MPILIRKTKVRIAKVFSLVLIFSVIILNVRRAHAAMLWVNRVNSYRGWRDLTSSQTGQFLAGVDNDIEISDDYGNTWNLAEGDIPDPDAHQWTSIASSADGQTLVATEIGGYIWISTNRGVNWTHEGISSDWSSVSITAAGTHAAAIDTTNHDVWLSTSANLLAWAKNDPFTASWGAVAYSPDDGTLAASQVSGYIVISTDNGGNWNSSNSRNKSWAALTAANGGKIAAIAGYQNIATSSDNGASWGDTGFGSPYDWRTIAYSADGSTLIAASTPGFNLGGTTEAPEVSTNSGLTWAPAPVLPTDQGWQAVASNSSGSFLAAAGYGEVWTTDIGTVSNFYFMDSDDADSQTLAVSGDTVEVFFEVARLPLITPTISFNGRAAVPMSNVNENNVDVWFANQVIDSSDPDGPFTFSATIGNRDGTATTTVTTTDEGSISVDNLPPVITLQGQSSVTVSPGSTYTDAGATASDVAEGDLTSSIVTTGTVDTSASGTYTITYNVSDFFDHPATPVTRTVIVSNPTPQSSRASGGSVSNAMLASLLAPSPATTAYLASRGNIGGNIAQTSSMQPSIVPVPPSFTMDLSLGMVNYQVRMLQQYLNAHNFPIAKSGPGSPGYETDRFAALTRSALIKFQKAHGISATGYFGPITRAFVNRGK